MRTQAEDTSPSPDEGVVGRAAILMVEDNPLTRKAMKVALEADGYAVIEAANAATALESARARRPDLVLLDLLLPDMHGVELARRAAAVNHAARS